jgi:predicted small lipoprotein YifL
MTTFRFLFSSSPRKRGPRGRIAVVALDSRLRGNDGGKKIAVVLCCALVALALAGCGKKAPPGPPPGVPNTFPQQYPQQ